MAAYGLLVILVYLLLDRNMRKWYRNCLSARQLHTQAEPLRGARDIPQVQRATMLTQTTAGRTARATHPSQTTPQAASAAA